MVNLKVKKPSFHLRLKPEAGSYATNPRWSNHDLDPVPVKLRVWGTWDYFSYWGSDMLAPPLWTTISTVMSLGFTARQVIPITFFGFFIIGMVISITGQIGAKYRVPYPVVARASFGMWGCIPAILLRTFVALMWTAITTVQGGGYLQNMVTAIWPSYNNFPNRFPANANVTSGGLLMIFLYWLIQTPTSMLPMSRLRYFFMFKMAVVPVCWFALFVWGAAITHGGGPLVTGPTNIPKGQSPWRALTALNVIIGLFSSLAVNMPDFGRFSKDSRSGYSQFFILPLLGTLGALAPIFTTSAVEQIWGEYIWFMPTVISLFHSRAAMFFTGFSFMIATMGNQIAAGTYCFGNDISALAPHYVDIRRASFLMGVFCIACTPWNIITEASALLSFLSGYSCMMGPIAGIICSDFYLVRKKKFDVGALYREHDHYWYVGGWNWRAWTAFLIPVSAVLPGFINSIQPTIKINSGAAHLYSFSWLFGFITAGFLYYIICTYISPPTSSFSEAILPPQTEEEEIARVEAAQHEKDSTSSVDDKELDEKERNLEKVQVVEVLA